MRHLANADLENALPKQPFPGEQRPKLSSGFRGVATTPVRSKADIKSFDRCAASGFAERHGDPKQVLEYRLALVRSQARLRPTDVVLDLGCGNGHHLLALASDIARGIGVDLSPGMIALARARLERSPWEPRLTFAVDDSEGLGAVAARSVDLAICIGAFEHMFDKRAVLASAYRVLKPGGRFFCLAANGDYVWYRTIAPFIGFATKHLSSDRFVTRDEFVRLLVQAGFCRIKSLHWTFIPKGDMPALIVLLLAALDIIGRHTRIGSLRGGLGGVCLERITPMAARHLGGKSDDKTGSSPCTRQQR
jgi:ubiquinone/menaquinone biosynthesis C-methylase UbiE